MGSRVLIPIGWILVSPYSICFQGADEGFLTFSLSALFTATRCSQKGIPNLRKEGSEGRETTVHLHLHILSGGNICFLSKRLSGLIGDFRALSRRPCIFLLRFFFMELELFEV